MTSKPMSPSTLAFSVDPVSKSTVQGVAYPLSGSSAHNSQLCLEPEELPSGSHDLSLLPLLLCKSGDLHPSPNTTDGCTYELKIKHDNPYYSYRPIYALGRSANLVMAFPRASPVRQPLPVKKTLVPHGFNPRKDLMQVSHPKIVRVMEAFYYGSSIFTVYEKMEVSLEQIAALPIQLEEHQVATMCSEVLKGLDFIHRKVGVRHGSLNAANILFSTQGTIKIGNISEALIQDQHEDINLDVQVFGQIISGLRETWSEEAAAFLAATKEKSCAELLTFFFVKKSRGYPAFKDEVQIALVSSTKTWSFCENFTFDSRSSNI